MVFASAMGLRLARFNAMLDVDKPNWQTNYFTGMPAPAGAITVLLPTLHRRPRPVRLRSYPVIIALYTLVLAFLLVSTIPTFSGKLLGERIRASTCCRCPGRRGAGRAADHLSVRDADPHARLYRERPHHLSPLCAG